MGYSIYMVDPKLPVLCSAMPLMYTPDLDATSSCDGPEGALAMSQFLGIRSRQLWAGLDLSTRGETERLVFSTLAI